MRVLLVDTETSGLSYEEGARVVEVAAALYDTKYASVIESFSALIRHDKNEAEHVNGIPVGLLLEHGDEPGAVWCRFVDLAQEAECLVAHRAEFDQGFVQKSLDALDVPGNIEVWEDWNRDKSWVCTKSDIEWPNKLRGDSLVQLALGLGLGVASAHRAMADVDTMARCLTRAQEVMTVEWAKDPCGSSGDWLEPLFRRAMRPKVRVVALVSFEQKDLAKDAGFFWEPQRREWYRRMPAEDVSKLPFRAVERA
jgi:DNA polymerase III subunit epsilon